MVRAHAWWPPEGAGDAPLPTWDPNLPAPPRDFPSGTTLALTAAEAAYLMDRIRMSAPLSFLNHLIGRPASGKPEFPWLHPAAADARRAALRPVPGARVHGRRARDSRADGCTCSAARLAEERLSGSIVQPPPGPSPGAGSPKV